MDSSLSFSEMGLRILAATVAGALIGIERETHGRPAGLRTTILTCVASAVAMVISEMLFIASAPAAASGTWRPDPARLGAGILTGIGFLGAGTILRHQNVIRGVTTAASLWFATVLGLAFGGGLYQLGVIGLAVALVTLLVLPYLEEHVPSDWHSKLTVTLELDALTEAQLRERLLKLGLKVKRMELDYNLAARQKIIITELKLERHKVLKLSEQTVADLRLCPGVLQVKWQ